MTRILSTIGGLLLATIIVTSCSTFRHTVGRGSKSNIVISQRNQWFALWGLVPLSPSPSVDGGHEATADAVADYTITTRYTFFDVIISALGTFISVHKQTVTVVK